MSELDEKALTAAWMRFLRIGATDRDKLAEVISIYLASAPAPTVSGDLAQHDANLARWKAERIHPAPTVSEEPVAWLRVRDDGRQTFWDRDVDGFCTPLYAHPASTRAEMLEEQDMLEAGRKYEDNRKPDLIIRDEPFYSGSQLRAAYRHGYDFARAIAGQKP